MTTIDKLLEPDVGLDDLRYLTAEQKAKVSAAISLKRIADAMERPKVSCDITLPDDLHNRIMEMAWEAGRSFKHGTEVGR